MIMEQQFDMKEYQRRYRLTHPEMVREANKRDGTIITHYITVMG